jgi:hypothetical protein
MATGAIRRDDQKVETQIKENRYGHSKYDAARNIPNPEQSNLQPQGLETSDNPQFLNTDPLHPAPAGFPSAHPTPIGDLKGQDTTGVTRGLDEWFISQNTILSQMLAAIKGMRPILPCFIRGGDNSLLANQPTTLKFVIGEHPVPALKLLIQNNTLVNVFFGLSEGASANGFILAPGQWFDSEVFTYALSLLTVTAQPLSGVNGQSFAAAVRVQAWTNPEWTRSWGQI